MNRAAFVPAVAEGPGVLEAQGFALHRERHRARVEDGRNTFEGFGEAGAREDDVTRERIGNDFGRGALAGASHARDGVA